MREREDYFGVNVDKLSMAMEDAGKEFQAAVARSGSLPIGYAFMPQRSAADSSVNQRSTRLHR